MESILTGILIIIAFLTGHRLGKNAVILTPIEKEAIKQNLLRYINKKPKVKIFNSLDSPKTQEEENTEELDKSFRP